MATGTARDTTTADAGAAGLPLPAAAAAFEATLIAKSPRTAANYRAALRHLAAFLAATGRDPDRLRTTELPRTVLEDFYTWLLERRQDGDGPAARRRRASAEILRKRRASAATHTAGARAFVRFLDRRGLLDPGCSYERMRDGVGELIGRRPYPTPRVNDAVAQVIVYVNTLPPPPDTPEGRQTRLAFLRDRAVLATLYGTGLRRAELAGLNRADVADGRAAEGLVTGKGERERRVFFDGASLAAIRAYLAARGDGHAPLFLRHDDGRGAPGPGGERWRLAPQSVWGIARRWGEVAGVKLTPHLLRHLKARTLLDRGAQLAEVQDLLGHASPETTKRIYAPYTTGHLREAFDRFSVSAEELAQGGEIARTPTAEIEPDRSCRSHADRG